MLGSACGHCARCRDEATRIRAALAKHDEKTALKPCPFCGGTGEVMSGFTSRWPKTGDDIDTPNFWQARCNKCEATAQMWGNASAAANAWNSRR